MKRERVCVSLLIMVCTPALAQSGGGFNLTSTTIDGGGADSSSADSRYKVVGTIGQADAGTLVDADDTFTLRGGFWVCPIASPPGPVRLENATAGLEVLSANRFLIINGGDPGRSQAIRVSLTDLKPPFDVWNGGQLWVGAPRQVSENASSIEPISGFANFTAATLKCAETCLDWSAHGEIHVFHEAIVPDSRYTVELVDCACDLGSESSYSVALETATSIWGDVLKDLTTEPPGPPNDSRDIIDVLGIIQRFASDPVAIRKARADLEPNCLDLVINITDALRGIAAFQGLPYPFQPNTADPCDSPCDFPDNR